MDIDHDAITEAISDEDRSYFLDHPDKTFYVREVQPHEFCKAATACVEWVGHILVTSYEWGRQREMMPDVFFIASGPPGTLGPPPAKLPRETAEKMRKLAVERRREGR